MNNDEFMKAVMDGKRMVDPDNGVRIHPNKDGTGNWYINNPNCSVFMILTGFTPRNESTMDGLVLGCSAVIIEPRHFIIDERCYE